MGDMFDDPFAPSGSDAPKPRGRPAVKGSGGKASGSGKQSEPSGAIKPSVAPSKYFIEKHLAEANHAVALEKAESWEERRDDETALVSAIIDGVVEDGNESSMDEAERTAALRFGDGFAFTDEEMLLTERQRLFVVEFCRLMDVRAAAVAAGYGRDGAKVQGGRCMANNAVRRCIEERLRRNVRVLAVDRRFLIGKALEVLDRVTQNVPVLDRDGNKTGVYAFDSAAALSAINTIARIGGLTEPEKLEVGPIRKPEGEIVEMDHSALVASVANRLRNRKDVPGGDGS